MTTNIDIGKAVPQERWTEFFDQFSDGNRGRLLSIRISNSELGDQELIQNSPLMAIVYDRPGKGNDLVIEVGQDEVAYGHTIDAPTQVLTGQDENGEIIALRVVDAAGTQTLITLQAS
ncbi:DUF5335 family protein [Pseudanabaenaceae cyanobacterium LEGE 13415]|nr:DUF5335 family protein [Pseudanabaenaceae cyanobacterium LEGE 13415]